MYDLFRWNTFLATLKTLLTQQPLPKLFLSYAWEGDSTGTAWLQQRLTRWRDDLGMLGVEVFFDLSAMGGKSDIEKTMLENLNKSDVVLTICTPVYGSRIKDTSTNVAYEYRETLTKLSQNKSSVIPLWLAGSRAEAIPEGLQSVESIDCRDALGHEQQLAQQLLSRLFPALVSEASYRHAWQLFTQSTFGKSVSSVTHKLKSLLPNVPADSVLAMSRLDSTQHSLPDFLWECAKQTRQVQRQPSVSILFEHGAAYRTAYWSKALTQEWDALVNTLGVLPLYIPLSDVDTQSTDLVSDYLMGKGFSELGIAALKAHYAILLILSGYEHRIRAAQLNLLGDSHVQEWRGYSLILCDSSQRIEAQFIDSVLQSQNFPSSIAHTVTYAPVAIEFDFMTAPSEEVARAPLERSALHRQTSRQESEPLPHQVLSQAQIAAHWESFVAAIAALKPMTHTVYLSYIPDSELAARITLLQTLLTNLGFRWTSEIERSDIIISICSPKYVAAIQQEKQAEYAAITTALTQPERAVYPLWYQGNNFAESVPKELFKLLVRDLRDTSEDYYQLGSLDNPLGLIPSLLDIRLGTPEGTPYQHHWQQFCQTVWGKHAQPSGLLHKLKVLSRTYAKQETLYQSTKRYYQDPQVKLTQDSGVSGNLNDFLQMLLAQATQVDAAPVTLPPVHLLFAEPGSGKSMSLLRLEEQLWTEFHRYHLIPIRIALNQIKPTDTDFMSRWLQDKAHYSATEIKQLQRSYRFLILLDGYDEFVFSHGETHNIMQLANSSSWPGVTLLTCRTQLDQQAGRFQTGERRYLCPFTTAQIDSYLAAQAKDKPELTAELRHKVHELPGLIELITNPLMLYITTDILPDLATTTVEETLTRYSVYERFNYKWFLREFVRAVQQGLLKVVSLRQQQLQAQLLHYAQTIAVLMFQESVLQVSEQKLDVSARALLRNLLIEDEQSQQAAIATLRNACPLKLIGDSYQFIHKSFQEFLVAQRLLQVLPLQGNVKGEAEFQQAAEFFQQQLANLQSNLWNQVELRKEPAVLNFLSDVQPNQYRLLQVITGSKGQLINHAWQGTPFLDLATGNALTLYNYCGYSFAGLNLSHIQAKQADVSGGLFFNTNLQHSYFADTRAAQVQLNHADLRYSRTQFKFGEQASLSHRSDATITNLVASPVNPVEIVTVQLGGRATCWDIRHRKILKSWWIYEPGTKVYLAYHHSGNLLSVELGGELNIWSTQTGKALVTLNLLPKPKPNSSGELIRAIAYYGDELCFSCFSNTIYLYSLQARQVLRTFITEKNYRSISAIARQGDCLVGVDLEGTVFVWSVSTGVCQKSFALGKAECRGELNQIKDVILEKDELITAEDKSGIIKISSLVAGACLRMIHTGMEVGKIVRHGDLLMVISEAHVALYSVDSGALLRKFRIKDGRSSASSEKGEGDFQDGKFIVGDIDGNLHFFLPETDLCTRVYENEFHVHPASTLDGDELICKNNIYSLITGKRIRYINFVTEAGDIDGNYYSNNIKQVLRQGDELIFGHADSSISLWSIRTGKLLKEFDFPKDQYHHWWSDHVQCIIRSGDLIVTGHYVPLVSGHHTGAIKIWSISQGKAIHSLTTDLGSVISLIWNGDTVIAGHVRGIAVWSTSTGQCVRQLPYKEAGCHLQLQNNQLLVGCGDKQNSIKIFDFTTDRCLQSFTQHHQAERLIYIAFHPRHADWVVSLDDEGLLLVWNIHSGKIITEQQLGVKCNHAIFDWQMNRLVLFVYDSILIFGTLMSQYWHNDEPLPPWHLSIRRPFTALEANALQIDGAHFADQDTVKLLIDRGAKGQPASSSFARVNLNTFFAIHHYLAKKIIERSHNLQDKITDFREILIILQYNPLQDALSSHLASAPSFKHANPLKDNRYFDLRKTLQGLSDDWLKYHYTVYKQYLENRIDWPAELPLDLKMIAHVEQLRLNFSV
jgi:WD40 repeat protein